MDRAALETRQAIAQKLAEIFRLARGAAGLSQGQVAKASGVSASYVSKLELGEVIPGAGKALVVCRALGLDPWAIAEAMGGKRPRASDVPGGWPEPSPLGELLEAQRQRLGRSVQGAVLAAAKLGRTCGPGAFRSALEGGAEDPTMDRLLAFAAGFDLQDWQVLAASGLPAPQRWAPEAGEALVEAVRPLKVVAYASAGEAFDTLPVQGDEVVHVPASSPATWALRVQGDSMCGARICHGDIVTVRPVEATPRDGRVVVAEALGQLLVKRFRAHPRPHLEEHFQGTEPKALALGDFRVLGEVLEAMHRVL